MMPVRQTEIEERDDKTGDPAVLIPASNKDGSYPQSNTTRRHLRHLKGIPKMKKSLFN